MKRRSISRRSAVMALSLVALVLPAQPAHAGITFGTATAVNPTGLTTANFTSLQGNLDGSILVAAAGYSYLLRSIDSGTSWSAITTAGIKDWYAVAINDSGTVIAAAEATGSVWLSTNSGTSWTQQTSVIPTNSNWYSMDMNASGSVIVASNQTSSVYVSINTGTSWTARSTSPASSTRGVAVSAIGDNMVLFSYGDKFLYTSSNTGANWSKQTNAGVAATAVMTPWISRDGQRILYGKYVTDNITHLGVSQNFGGSWETITAASTSMVAIAASDDLSKLWTAPNGSATYASINSGASWTTGTTATNSRYMYINPTGTRWVSASGGIGIYTSDGIPSTMTYRPINLGVSNWGKSASSSDGSVIVAASNLGEINVSRDAGTTWSAATTLGRNNAWNCVAVSGDGNAIYVGGYLTRLYKSTDKGINWTSLSGGTLPASAITVGGCATNSDGSKVAILYSGSGIHISSNSGSTFALSQSRSICLGSNEFVSVTMTSNGSKLAAICSDINIPIMVSTNSGGSWSSTTATTTRYFKEIKCSGDGSVLIATIGDTYQSLISTDWGTKWNKISGVGTNLNTALSINSDGTVILIGQTGATGNLYYSLNRGVSFYQVPGSLTGSYKIAQISADSTRLIFGVDGRQLHTMTVSLVFVQSDFSGITLNAQPAYRTQVTITATIGNAGADGKVTFFANGKKITGCIKVTTNSLVATCSWKPSNRGAVTLSATSYPSDSTFISGSATLPITVDRRSGLR